jgi:hypothetical protein
MIEWGAEQGHHFGVEICRGWIALPVVVVFYGVPNLQSGEAVWPVELLQDGIAQLAGLLAGGGAVPHQIGQPLAGVAIRQQIDIGDDKQRAVSRSDARGQAAAYPRQMNDFTRLYWRSSIGLPIQQLKAGGGGGG